MPACTNCGAKLISDDVCDKCGYRFDDSEEDEFQFKSSSSYSSSSRLKSRSRTPPKKRDRESDEELHFHPYRRTLKEIRGRASHNMKSSTATYDGFKFHDDPKFKLGATGAGITLSDDHIIKRTPHSFRTPAIALNRILTYLAENMLSNLIDLDFASLAEVQIGWISELNCMLITENNVALFNSKIAGKSFSELLDMLKSNKGSKLNSQGVADYCDARLRRHKSKLDKLLEGKSRYDAWVALDKNVADLMTFLSVAKNTTGKIITIGVDTKFEDMRNSIAHYHDDFSFKTPTQHAELYHLGMFKQVAEIYKKHGDPIPNFYVAGTKRACSTCAGELAAAKASPLLAGHLFADEEHPGNLWPKQMRNQSELGIKSSLKKLRAYELYITRCRKFKSTGLLGTTTGFNSDSESDEDV